MDPVNLTTLAAEYGITVPALTTLLELTPADHHPGEPLAERVEALYRLALEKSYDLRPRVRGPLVVASYSPNLGESHETFEWPAGWPVPRVAERVHLPGQPPADVSQVTWFPVGDGSEVGPMVLVLIEPIVT